MAKLWRPDDGPDNTLTAQMRQQSQAADFDFWKFRHLLPPLKIHTMCQTIMAQTTPSRRDPND